ncbi:MAG: AAA family ATPase [Elainellaceae cyanobacterium]
MIDPATRDIPSIPGYRIAEQIFEGPRTRSYRAWRGTQRVIIEVLWHQQSSLSNLSKLHQQYAIAQSLDHPAIARPLALEFYEGGYALVIPDAGLVNLKTYWPRQRRDVSETLAIALQLTDALDYLIEQRIVHKGIRPSNILIHPETGHIQLTDFSAATSLPKERQLSTSVSAFEDGLAYISPEQTGRMNRNIDYRTDFYSLGATLFELLVGQPPFTADDPMTLVHCHLARPVVFPQESQQTAPAMVQAILTKLMAKTAEDRYQSALGLKHDLEVCLQQWEDDRAIAKFELGAWDKCDRFLIPETIYGREREIQAILNTFDRTAAGSAELLLVAGSSGIGKTSIIGEVYKPIVRQRGYLTKGKFDQVNYDIPLSAFAQALQNLVRQLLTEADERLNRWKARILSALGDDGQLIIDLVPELEIIIGPQPPVSRLTGPEAQQRFYRLLQQFIQVFATSAHPLVIFLDDLQWIDSASLSLIEILLQQRDCRFLLLLGAYRDNEVSAGHPLMLMLERLTKARLPIQTLILGPLEQAHINQLITDTLNCSDRLSETVLLPLAQLIYQIAKGNPFFTTQLLRSFYENGLIEFDRTTGSWRYDMSHIKPMIVSGDVAKHVSLQLQKLPVPCQDLLKLGACIGNQFDLEILAIVTEQSVSTVATQLWPALQEGFIVPQSESYTVPQLSDRTETITANGLVIYHVADTAHRISYKFLHDYVQQSAYAMIVGDRRQATHLHIGQLLLAQTPDQNQPEPLFEIVNHLNIGRSLLRSQEERENLAQLNLKAGHKAKSATAHSAAVNYFTIGITLLPPNAWTSHYNLALELHTALVEACALNTDFDQMEQWALVVLEQAQALLDTIDVQQTRLIARRSQGRLIDAIQTGLQVLQSLGIDIPEHPTQTDIAAVFQQTAQLWKGRSPLELLDLPAMTDRNCLAAMQILSWLVPCAYGGNPALNPLLICKQVDLSIRCGNCSTSIYGYVDYALMLCGVTGDISSGYDFGRMALLLMDRLQDATCRARTWYVFYTYIQHWKSPLQDSVVQLQEGFHVGLGMGDLDCGTLNIASYCCLAFHSGKALSELADEMTAYYQTVCQLKQVTPRYYMESYLQTVHNLLGHSAIPQQLTGSILNCTEALHQHEATNNKTALFSLQISQLFLSYLFGCYEQAVQIAIALASHLDGGAGTFTIALYSFYTALSQLARYRDTSPEEQRQLLNQIESHQRKLERWASFAPCNHQHRWDLVEAERCAVLGDRLVAIERYDEAIAGAKENGFIQDEALANERAAQFYLNWGKPKLATGYIQAAYQGYARWGAKAKTDDLEKRYSTFLQPILQSSTLDSLEALASIAAPNTPLHSLLEASQGASHGFNKALDFAAILEASQALSKTIELDTLLRQLTQIILKNSGGDRCVLMLPDSDDDWRVTAIATPEMTEPQSELIQWNISLPLRLIQYVKHTQSVVVLNDLETDLPIIDEYLRQHNPKSLLCFPMLNQGRLVGLLYLTNQYASGVFTRDRILVLNFLCTQAAISLENARLYRQAQAYAQQLEASELQIVQSEKTVALGNLVAGVAHEINNPIGFVSGNLSELKRNLSDIFDHLQLYQGRAVAEEVQRHAQQIEIDFLSEDIPKMLASMERGCDRIRALSTSLRIFSRSDVESKVNTNIHEGIDSTLLLLKYRLQIKDFRPDIEIIRHYGELPEISCFPGQLNQVFMNILANAIDMFDEDAQGCSLDDLQSHPQRIIISTRYLKPNQVEVRIGDNGRGMSEEVCSKVFERNFTTKAVGKGTGLGLAIARQVVVEKHRGTLEVQSEPGKGTEFVIRLPCGAS